MPNKAALSELKRRLKDSVLTDERSLYWKSFDGSKLAFPIDAVVQPKNEKEISVLLKLANKRKIPVTTRGAGSSLTGSASAVNGGWVLDLSKFNKIRIDKVTGMAYVGAGAVLEKIQQKAKKLGWFYPPDPSSKKYCTIGGTIACNAGGMTGGKYGVTRDYVYGLKGFLPTGETVQWAGDLRKYVSGYNMKDLWIGSEGTLGVITEAVIKLLPLPECKWTVMVAFKDDVKALTAVKKLLETRTVPSIFEFLDKESVFGAERRSGETLFKGISGAPMLLLELDGRKAEVEENKKTVLKWAKEFGLAYSDTYDESKAEELWDVRRACSPAMFELGDSKINEDIVVPLRNQVKLIRFLKQIKKETGLHVPTFGHAADGNFHVNIMFNRGDKKQERAAKKAVFMLMKKVVELGGAVTGEHGIGLAKTPFMKIQHNKAEIAAMKAIKDVLDPNGILNPGKIFEEYEVWNHVPEKVMLPWDHKK